MTGLRRATAAISRVPGNASILRLKIVQAGEPVLRKMARELTPAEIAHPAIQELIVHMRDTMRDAPGVGLAAPQVGLGLQLAVIEDRAEYMNGIPAALLEEREREAVPFLVLVNPRIVESSEQTV